MVRGAQAPGSKRPSRKLLVGGALALGAATFIAAVGAKRNDDDRVAAR